MGKRLFQWALLLLVCLPLGVTAKGFSSAGEVNCWLPVSADTTSGGMLYEKALSKGVADFQVLVERSLVYRGETLGAALRLEKKLDLGKPLNGADLEYIHEGMLAHLTLRKSLYKVAESRECWVSAPAAGLRAMGIDNRLRLKGVMLSLAAALVLYDNYLLAVSMFEENGKLRRLLNQDNISYGIDRDKLTEVTLEYYSLSLRERVRTGLKFYATAIKTAPKGFLDDPQNGYLNLLLLQSPSYGMVRRHPAFMVLQAKLDIYGHLTKDGIRSLSEDGINLVSMLFGNSVGLIESRKGKLYSSSKLERMLKQRLKAGDVLLEKTPFRLTDKFIPGYWGHVAIWLGTEQELTRLGIWKHPVVQPYHQQIREGRLVVEALRAGVSMNPLSHFLNIDDLAVIRHKSLDRQGIADILIRTLRQIGKAYDFNFDVETSSRIVCSELIYAAYTDIDWPTEKTLGRFTISPDNVARKAYGEDAQMELVLLMLDGLEVEQDQTRTMAQLVEEE
ncbi:MAG: Poxvirus G6 [Gammaproteobacteria bacterium]|nr:Poxvirus G6 [Gammaproteobacteria bacterium]